MSGEVVSVPKIDIRPDYWVVVQGILRRHVPEYEVWAFGSRAKWTAKEYSDLDLAIVSDHPVPLKVIAALADDFSESSLPWKVDVVDWATVSDEFQKIIERDRVVVQEAVSSSVEPVWRYELLENVAAPEKGAIAIGPFGSRLKTDAYTKSGVGLIRGQNLTDSKALSGEFVFVSDETARTLGNANVKPFDLVFPHRGNIGSVGIVPEVEKKYALSTSLMKITLDRKKVEPLFLYYFFRSSQGRAELLKNASQVGTPGIATPLTSLRACVVPVPPVAEQAAIAQFLSLLDDRIDLLRQTNATLESIAQALFKSWFIDFDPVCAKAEGREPEGMDAETAALFPDSFEDSARGEIPKGWRARKVGEIFSLIMGQSPPGDTYNTAKNGIPFYQGRTDFGFRFPSERVYCTAPTRFASAGATLVSVRAPVGDVNVATNRCAIGRGLAAVEFERAPAFALYSMKALRSKFTEFEAHGTVFGSINKKQFEALPCILPSIEVLSAFSSIAGVIDERVRVNELCLRSLTELRDTFLPRLVSGKLHLPDAQAQLNEAVV